MILKYKPKLGDHVLTTTNDDGKVEEIIFESFKQSKEIVDKLNACSPKLDVEMVGYDGEGSSTRIKEETIVSLGSLSFVPYRVLKEIFLFLRFNIG
ncbi:hypothetical protein CR203_18300 [Salipaludibacillus neizhouensis]|uniref:Uncharacterized protein n=1 Tax=Salipaludibacillus neizhouensis TaxID=885475 RepID=A0A3A9K837_9BACI|nr:hypothetical protein [Salipaludibacillus neizhouensis]RKL65813.1 hypothetical protein CR203_18300 [Salipaludibacillus neizhouensis]